MRLQLLATTVLLTLAGAAGRLAQQSAPSAVPMGAAPPAAGPPQSPAQQIFTGVCAGCHGTTLAGGRGPSLFAEPLLAGQSDDALLHIIQNGRPDAGMPSFRDQYPETQLRQVIAYLRVQGGRLKDRPVFVPNPDHQLINSQKQAFRIEVVTAGLDTPWGLAFLPDGRMLVTERSGHLRIIDKAGKLLPDPVKGTPIPFVRQDGGLLDVVLHPDYRRNGWIYLSYTEVKPGVTPAPGSDKAPVPAPPTMTVFVRGRLDGANQWVDQQTIFKPAPDLYTTTSDHYGSRFLFDRSGHLFYSLGERHNMANAQNLAVPLGKIHRTNDDGSAARGNPFAANPGALATVWSYGHRNPEGLAFNPVTGDLWETEHGPTGGDEINVIQKGHNYGWGLVSMGLEPGITRQQEPGMDDPVAFYTPTIAPSGMTFYAGTRYPGWKNNLFVAALAGQELLRIETSGRKIVAQEVLFKQYGRVRDVKTGPDGLLYVLLQNPTGAGTGVILSAPTAGMVIRLVPVAG
jgi:glucose/arabinose dehydrogenase/cytochrome c5